MSLALHIVRVGVGPTIVWIHGSAADHTTWSIQLRSAMRNRFALVAFDRRRGALAVEDHADDAAALADAPCLIVGSSFGAVIALDVVRRHPGAVVGAVLIEPPMPASDQPDDAARAIELLAAYDRRIAEHGGPAAAELFLQTVLGQSAYDRMPRMFLERSTAKWAEIRDDSAALVAYRPRYDELRSVDLPVLLLGGGRSAAIFRPTLDALHAALPRARLEIVAAAGHMLHAEAHRRFAELVTEFATAAFAERGLA